MIEVVVAAEDHPLELVEDVDVVDVHDAALQCQAGRRPEVDEVVAEGEAARGGEPLRRLMPKMTDEADRAEKRDHHAEAAHQPGGERTVRGGAIGRHARGIVGAGSAVNSMPGRDDDGRQGTAGPHHGPMGDAGPWP